MKRAAICGLILGTLALPALAAISFDEERQVALWILRRGGQVMVDGVPDPIGDPFNLPDRDFRIVVVDLHGTVIEPKQLIEIQKLEHVKELYVPARVWSPVSDVKAPFSDESFQYYQGMKQLERFNAGLTTLAWLDIGDEGVKRMAPLTQLKHLRLNNTTIKDPKCFEALVNLESLDLGDAYVLDNSLAPLANMKNLKRLNLLGTLITDDGLKYLRDLTQMEDLDLYGVKITDTGVEHLRKMSGLRRLNMLGGQVTDASAEILSQFRELRELNLYRSRITDAGLTKLQALKNLETLDLRYSGVTSAGVQAFHAAVPRCKITFVDSAPRLSSSKNSAPQGTGEAAMAKWIEGLGGQVRMAGNSIQSISLPRVGFDDKKLKYLEKLPALEKLNLDGTDVSDLGLESIGKLTGLRDLSLSFTSVSDRGLAYLGGLKSVRRLMLAGTRVSGPGFSHLAGWTELQELDLTSTPVTNEAMPFIGKMTKLERLLLSYSDVTDEGLPPLANLPNLAILDLHGVDVKDAGMPHLAAAKGLRELNLSDGRFSDRGLALLAVLPKLERINLTRVRITEKGLDSLTTFPALQGLTLDYVPVSDKSLESFKRLPSLKQLSLDSTNITDRGAEVLQTIATLQSLDLYHTPVSKKAYEALRAALPQCQVFYDDQSSNPNRKVTKANEAATVSIFAAMPLLAADPGWIAKLGGRIERDSAGRTVGINLRGSWINDADIIELARLPDLERLDLSHTRISDEGMLNLKPAPKIKELKLFYSEWITDQGMTAIKEWKHLKRLDVRGTRISDGTIEIVSKMPGLEALDIAHTEVTDVGLENLITLINLKELAVGRGRLSNAGLVTIRMLPALTMLDLSGARPTSPDAPAGRGGSAGIPEETLKAIAELTELKVLNLGYAAINADGLRVLGSLAKIEKLGLQGCSRVDDAALAELAKWKSLKYLDVQEAPVTEKGLSMLKAAKPGIKVLSGGKPPAAPAPYNR